MGDQQRVTFHFGDDAEVQYLQEVPAIGDYVSHHDALWTVSNVEDDGLGALVTCELTREDATSDEHARRGTL